MTLREALAQATEKKVAIGHFNVSDLLGVQAIFSAARKLQLPVIIGVSEGERDAVGVRQIAAVVRSIREQYEYPIYLNADHTHSFDRIREAVEAGFDAVLFDAGKELLEENIEETKKVVAYVREYNALHGTDILVEGELGYIGSSSVLFEALPQGAAIEEKDLTSVADAIRFVLETGVDLLAPAVGNVHGMFAHGKNPALHTDRITQIAEGTRIPLVLHGGSGLEAGEFIRAVGAGVRIVHINTELRVAWKRGFNLAFLSRPNEVVPYKLFPDVIHEMQKVVEEKLELFNTAQS